MGVLRDLALSVSFVATKLKAKKTNTFDHMWILRNLNDQHFEASELPGCINQLRFV